MTNVNMANRQYCDLDIRNYRTKAPWLYADFCNTTTMGFSNEPVRVNKKGQKCIKFNNPLDGTIAIAFQVHPFEVYAMSGNSEIETSAVITGKRAIACTVAGSLTLADASVTGTVFVYAEDDFSGKAIEGTIAEEIFTAITSSRLAMGTSYVVGYLEKKGSGIRKISFNNKKVPKNPYIQMPTPDKNEDGKLVPVRIIICKTGPQRNLGLSFSSDSGPIEITITCSALMDDSGNVLDMIGISDEAE